MPPLSPNQRTKSDKLYLLAVLAVFILGVILRLVNYNQRIIFGPEQAISLSTSASYLEKFSLLGEINVQRQTSTGLNPFHGALFNYFLVPFILLFNFEPQPITYIFLLLNLITAIALFLVTKKIFGKSIALFSLFFFMVSPKMIHHSLFIWNLNFLPLLGILSLHFFYKLFKNHTRVSPVFALGLLGGIGFGLQYLYLPFIILTLLLSVSVVKNKMQSLLLFVAGGLIGASSMILFDLRHQFYYTQTLWQYFVDVFYQRAMGRVHYYDFMYLYPFLYIVLGVITSLIFKWRKTLVVIPLGFALFQTIRSPHVNFSQSTGVVPGINLKVFQTTSQLIYGDRPETPFNVATLHDFDTKARPIRYFLKYKHHLTPNAEEQYENLKMLYVLAPANFNFNGPIPYELTVQKPFSVKLIAPLSIDYYLYKLTK